MLKGVGEEAGWSVEARTHTYRHVLALARLGRSHAVGSLAAVPAGVLFGYSLKFLQERLSCQHASNWSIRSAEVSLSKRYLLSNKRAPRTERDRLKPPLSADTHSPVFPCAS